MSETMANTARTITAINIFGDDVPTTTPDAVSSPSISSPEEKTNGPVMQGTKRTRMKVHQMLASLEHFRSNKMSPTWDRAEGATRRRWLC